MSIARGSSAFASREGLGDGEPEGGREDALGKATWSREPCDEELEESEGEGRMRGSESKAAGERRIRGKERKAEG
eukprot:3805846-Rhodomonas_salina.2